MVKYEPRQHIIDAELANGNLNAWKQVLGFPARCLECENYVDPPSKFCPRCQVYKDYQK